MASSGRKGEVGVFFIYDHNRLKKEEDDIKDAILYFYPNYIDNDEQCLVCGQLMGMAEFFLNTISKSPPKIFRFQKEKFCFKRVGFYSFVLQGNVEDADIMLINHLDYLYNSFVLYCGSVDYIKQQYGECHRGFIAELNAFWDILLPTAGYHDNHLYQVFQVLPSVELPKSGRELFLQSSNILQSSQRRPGVLVGTLMYKNRVLCSQMSPDLTRKLILISPQLPCHNVKTDYELPVGVRLLSVFLSDEEQTAIKPLYKKYNLHCKSSRFTWYGSESQDQGQRAPSASPRRFQKLENIPEKDSSFEDINYCKASDLSGVKNLENNAAFSKHLSPSSENRQLEYQTQKSLGFISNENQSQYQMDQSKYSKKQMDQSHCNESQKSLLEKENDFEILAPVITISGEEATISDYEEDDIKGEKRKKQKLAFGKNGYKSPPSKAFSVPHDSVAIEDFEQENFTNDTMTTEKSGTSYNRYKHLPAIEDFEKQNVSKNNIVIAVDIHASFQDSFESEKVENKELSDSDITGNPSDAVNKRLLNSDNDITSDRVNPCNEAENQSFKAYKLSEEILDDTISKAVSTASVKLKNSGESDEPFQDVDVTEKDIHSSALSVDLQEECKEEINSENNVDEMNNESNVTEDDRCAELDTVDLNIENHKNAQVLSVDSQILDTDSSEKKPDEQSSENPVLSQSADFDQNDVSADHKNMLNEESDLSESMKSEQNSNGDDISQTETNHNMKQTCTDENYHPNANVSSVNEIPSNADPTRPISPDVECKTQVDIDNTMGELAVQVDGLSVADQTVSISPSLRGENTSPESSASDGFSSEKKETLDFPVSDSQGISADESASEMPHYKSKPTNQIGSSMQYSEPTIQIEGHKNQQFSEISNSTLPSESSNQIGDSFDSLGSSATLVSTEIQSCSSDIEGLNEMTMYVQRHSDISLLLLMDGEVIEDSNVVISLWKSALPHLADLDFYVKECTDFNVDEPYMDNQNYIQYDSFFQNIKGNVMQPLTGGDEEFHRLAGSMHESFNDNPGMTDIIHRSHSGCCYGHRTVNNETFYQSNSNVVQASSLPSAKHPIFSMDTLGAKELSKKHNINLL